MKKELLGPAPTAGKKSSKEDFGKYLRSTYKAAEESPPIFACTDSVMEWLLLGSNLWQINRVMELDFDSSKNGDEECPRKRMLHHRLQYLHSPHTLFSS